MPAAFSPLWATEAPSTLRIVETLPPPTSCSVLDNELWAGNWDPAVQTTQGRRTWLESGDQPVVLREGPGGGL